MKIWIARHGQTDLNKNHCLQGRVDQPLNHEGRRQASEASILLKGLSFDAIYASPLERAQETGELLSGISREHFIIDPRITEMDFGARDAKPYFDSGFDFGFFWLMPKLVRAPADVEDLASLARRTGSFICELKEKDYNNVLVVCHGGAMRGLSGALEGSSKGARWYPRPKNCEIRCYDFNRQKGTVKRIKLPEAK